MDTKTNIRREIIAFKKEALFQINNRSLPSVRPVGIASAFLLSEEFIQKIIMTFHSLVTQRTKIKVHILVPRLVLRTKSRRKT